MSSDYEFYFGVGVGIALGALYLHNSDFDAATQHDHLGYGEKACIAHEGLMSFDLGGDYTCTDGTVIHKPSGNENKKPTT